MITGSYEYVGNWAGVTVEKKVGMMKNKKVQITDLPGVYSISPLSADETVATRFLMDETFSSIINIIDASQLERNLFLTIQLMEFGKPVMVALNMIDVAKGRGMTVDPGRLSRALNVPVLPVVARTGKGCDVVVKELQQDDSRKMEPLHIDYGEAAETVISAIAERAGSIKELPTRWLALQFLEGNGLVTSYLEQHIDAGWLEQQKQQLESYIQQNTRSKSLQQYIRQIRGEWIAAIVDQAVMRSGKDTLTLTDRIDRIVTNRFAGIPIFLVVMYFIFKLTFDWLGSPLSDLLDGFINGTLADWVESMLNTFGAAHFIKDLVLSGIIGGVGGVLVFVPQIFILFLLISFIEDSGYMARIAMVMDRMMEAIGLNGKAFIPMIIGFGCNVPGIMAARTVEQPKDRIKTILLIPLMSCSARLPVYSLFVGTFFIQNQSAIVFSLYVLGIVVALLMAKVFSLVGLKEKNNMFFIELPPYRIPQWRTLALSTWEKGKGFIRKAGTFIFGGSVLIWFLSYAGPGGFNVEMDKSFLAMIGGFIAPILQPIGFGSWQAGASLLTGFMAKEVVVSTMNIIYVAPSMDALHTAISHSFTSLQALCFMVFVLLYVPCLATVAVIAKETASKKWTWISVLYSLGVAYIICLVIYQVGKLLGY